MIIHPLQGGLARTKDDGKIVILISDPAVVSDQQRILRQNGYPDHRALVVIRPIMPPHLEIVHPAPLDIIEPVVVDIPGIKEAVVLIRKNRKHFRFAEHLAFAQALGFDLGSVGPETPVAHSQVASILAAITA